MFWKIKTEKKGKQPLGLAEAHSLPGLPAHPRSPALSVPFFPLRAAHNHPPHGPTATTSTASPAAQARFPSSSRWHPGPAWQRPVLLLHVKTEQVSFSGRTDPEIQGFPCQESKPRPIKPGGHPRDPLLPSIAPREALAASSTEFWISPNEIQPVAVANTPGSLSGRTKCFGEFVMSSSFSW